MFTLIGSDNKARAGIIKTAHGDIHTPIFAPIGTSGSVKAIDQEMLEKTGASLILANTHHLYLRPGHRLIEKVAGGLHGFMAWRKPILTDSGGFQIHSLASFMQKASERGMEFRSHIDGSLHLMSPEKSMEIQRALGADIVMAFDYCTSLPADKKTLAEGMSLSLNWAKRCCNVSLRDYQHFFAIIQGGLHMDLRLECMEKLQELNPAGFALGGLSVGEKNEQMEEFCDAFVEKMPADRPRYLMGVGTPLDILTAVKAGVDMFDCVIPTRNGRKGQVMSEWGAYNIKRECFKEDDSPLEPDCICMACQRYSRAYIHHLHRNKEPLAATLISFHNLFFYINMMKKVREAILNKEYDCFYENFRKRFLSKSIPFRVKGKSEEIAIRE